MNIKEKNRTLSRRKFVGQAAAGSAFAVLGPLAGLNPADFQQAGTWPAGASKFGSI